VLYTTSATESWEIISQDLIVNKSSHFYNGEFGKKWFEYAKFIKPSTEGFTFDENKVLDLSAYPYDKNTEMICITLNETSTGTQVKSKQYDQIIKDNPNTLLAIDATSCIGGIKIEFEKFDVVYGSVQKCFGLPAGLGLLIVSPRAIAKANEIGIKGRYNSLLRMLDHIKVYQTSFTPNVLNIYLMSRVLDQMLGAEQVDAIIKNRAKQWYSFIEKSASMELHITNKEVQSDTVITVKTSAENVLKIKKEAKAAGFDLGSGYGPLKDTTFRIANFPAITEDEINKLQAFLSKY
jgi:phosphoserine aminotransferase